jgi:hypothetical protein
LIIDSIKTFFEMPNKILQKKMWYSRNWDL